MQIHELPAQTTAADADVVAVDNGTTTQKMTVANLGKKITEDAAPAFTSGDSSEAASWTNVDAVTSGLSLKNILNRITTMMKNVRYLYSLLGTTDITGSGKNTVSGAIGGTSISDIGDGTLTGAVDALNGKIGETDISGIGGTVTEAISKLNTDVNDYSHLSFTVYGNRVTVLESSTYRCGEFVIVYFKCTANQALNENTIIQGLPVPGAKQGLSVNLGSAWAEIRAIAADGIVAANISNGQTFVLFGVYNILGVPN